MKRDLIEIWKRPEQIKGVENFLYRQPMEFGISVADSGTSYLIPCLIEKELKKHPSKTRAVITGWKNN